MPYIREVDDRWTFRNANTKEYTHGYHAYPAMMIPQVARALMEEYSPNGEFKTILDPYMGSGTTLVEASIKGVDSIGTDLNPLARMMSKVKTTHYNEDLIRAQFTEISFHLSFYDASKVLNRNFDRVSNYTYWYSEDTLLKLSYLQQLIEEYANNNDFFKLILAEIVRDISSDALKASFVDSIGDVIATGAVVVGMILAKYVSLPFNIDGIVGILVAIYIMIMGNKVSLNFGTFCS